MMDAQLIGTSAQGALLPIPFTCGASRRLPVSMVGGRSATAPKMALLPDVTSGEQNLSTGGAATHLSPFLGRRPRASTNLTRPNFTKSLAPTRLQVAIHRAINALLIARSLMPRLTAPRADHVVPNDRPRARWVKSLVPYSSRVVLSTGCRAKRLTVATEVRQSALFTDTSPIMSIHTLIIPCPWMVNGYFKQACANLESVVRQRSVPTLFDAIEVAS